MWSLLNIGKGKYGIKKLSHFVAEGGNMKKFTKSVIAVLMMACMLFSLTACGNGTTTGDKTPSTETTPTKAPATTEAAE